MELSSSLNASVHMHSYVHVAAHHNQSAQGTCQG